VRKTAQMRAPRPPVPAGERLAIHRRVRDERAQEIGLWRTLGYRLDEYGPGESSIAWTAGPEYGFRAESGYFIQGGMVTAVLDAAMGSAAWTVLDLDQVYLTADLRVEFLRGVRPGPVVAHGSVLRRTRRAVFCEAELEDADGVLLAASRCTQIVLPADGHAGRGRVDVPAQD
jgi:uncharacterized protein (TIGR00369 family)